MVWISLGHRTTPTSSKCVPPTVAAARMGEMTTQDIVYISAEALVGFVTVAGNVIVLVAIICTRSLHTITNVFIGNLAVADIAVGIFVAPCAALSFLGLPSGKYGCIFINCAILMFTNISILMLLTIAVERFIAIKFPFTYKKHATVKSAILVNLSIWVVGSILGLLPLLGWNKAPDDLTVCAFTDIISMEYMVYFQFFAITFTPLFIILLIYLYIFFIVRQHTKQTRALENLFRDPQTSRNRRRWDKDVQAAKMFATLFFLFSLFWLPVNILNSITLFCPTCQTPYPVLLVAIVLSHANSSVNPFLYATNNSRIKIAIKNVFSMNRSEQNQLDSFSQGHTSHADKENKPHPDAALPNGASKGHRLQNLDKKDDAVQTNGNGLSENAENARSNKNTRVSFVTQLEVVDLKGNSTVNEHNMEQYPQNDKNNRRVSQALKQTHSFRDEIDNNILDRITPLEGMMANIYNSLDSETRDIIENKSVDHNTQNILDLENKTRSEQNENVHGDISISHSSRSSNTLPGKDWGHVNHAFVDDSIHTEGSPSENIKDKNIAFINIKEPNNCVIDLHSDSSPPHSYSTSTPSKPMATPKLLRSLNVQSTDGLSSPISQKSAVNVASDNHFSESSMSLHTQISRTPQIDSNPILDSSPPINDTTTECPNSRPTSTIFTGSHSTTQNVFLMESENDDNIMSVKYFEDSQETANSAVSCEFDNRVILRNHSTESTHL